MTNSGTAGATGPWVDNVYLSTTPTLGAGAIYLGSFTAESSGSLAPSGTYNGQATVQLPINSSLSAGTYYLVVVADAGGVVNESDLTTEQSSAPITLAVPPPPDLAVSSVTSSLTAAQPGQSETVTWTVTECRRRAGDRLVDRQRLPLAGRQARDATLLGLGERDGRAGGSGLLRGHAHSHAALEPLADGTLPGHRRDRRRRCRRHRPQPSQQPEQRSQALTFGHVDLVPSITAAPATATSGTTLTVTWSTTNREPRRH